MVANRQLPRSNPVPWTYYVLTLGYLIPQERLLNCGIRHLGYRT